MSAIFNTYGPGLFVVDLITLNVQPESFKFDISHLTLQIASLGFVCTPIEVQRGVFIVFLVCFIIYKQVPKVDLSILIPN